MSFNIFDILTAVYVGLGSWRGGRRGLTFELPRLIWLLLFILTGCSLSHWMRLLFSKIGAVTGQAAGGLGFLGVFAAAFIVARRLRARFGQWLAQRLPVETVQKRGGAVAGGLRALVISCTLIVFIGLMPLGFISVPFRHGSFIGRHLIRLVVPAYEKIAGQDAGK